MSKAIELVGTEIHCDNKSCTYVQRINPEEIKQWVNQPCPHCGENLLTKKDYYLSLTFDTIVKTVNRLIGEVAGDSPSVKVSVKSDTRGGFTFEQEKGE